MKKRFLVSIMMVLCFIVGTSAFAMTGITFTRSGNQFIYSDNPESFGLHQNDCKYLYGTSLGQSYKDVEYYHHFYNAWGNTGACRVGVAIRNSNPTPTTITYKGSYIAKDEDADGDNFALQYTPNVLKGFMDASTQAITIPAYGSTIVWANDFNFTPSKPKFVFGRAQFKSSKSSNVWLRVFAAGQSKTANDVFNISSYEPANGKQFCGQLDYTQKDVTLSATSGDTFAFCEWPKNLNTDEYDGVLHYKSGGLSENAGNFGVVYNINITNAAGKKIKITPRWSDNNNRTKASIVYSLNNGSWIAREPITTNMCWYLSLGSNPTANFKFILPGGNCGNYDISFD